MAQNFVFDTSTVALPTSGARTYSTLRDIIRRNLGNDAAYFTDEDINREIGMALDECSEHTEAYIQATDITTADGTYAYSIDGLLQVEEVIWDNNRLTKVDDSAMFSNYYSGKGPDTAQGNPVYWAQMSMSEIWLYPTPLDARTLTIRATQYAPEYSNDGDTNVFIKAADKYIIFQATAMLLLRDNELGRYPIYRKRAEDAMDDLMRLTSQKPVFAETSADTDYSIGD